jgi:hypothetical protein
MMFKQLNNQRLIKIVSKITHLEDNNLCQIKMLIKVTFKKKKINNKMKKKNIDLQLQR